MYTQASVKRQKTKERPEELSEFFTGVSRIEYKPEGPFDDLLRYRYYNATERLQGRSMEDWLRPTLSLSRGFSTNCKSVIRPWIQTQQTIENYKRSIRYAFELCMKLGMKWWSAYDRDLTPEVDSIEETQQYMDEIKEYIFELQQRTLLKPLWLSADLHTHKRFTNGSCTNSEILIINQAGYQVKKVLDMGNKLGAECFLFTAEQEAQHNMLNSELSRDLKHYAQFLRLIDDYKERMGYRQQLLIDSTNNSNIHERNEKLNYLKDPLCVLSFLKHFDLDKHFKINFSPQQNFSLLGSLGTLGSIDMKNNQNVTMSNIVMLMRYIVHQGGITPGGLNIRLPFHDGLYEPKDLAEAYVSTIDMYAKALRIAVKLVNDSTINRSIQSRYVSFSTGWGAHFESSAATLEECEEQIKKNSDAACLKIPPSIRYDHWDVFLNQTIEMYTK